MHLNRIRKKTRNIYSVAIAFAFNFKSIENVDKWSRKWKTTTKKYCFSKSYDFHDFAFFLLTPVKEHGHKLPPSNVFMLIGPIGIGLWYLPRPALYVLSNRLCGCVVSLNETTPLFDHYYYHNNSNNRMSTNIMYIIVIQAVAYNMAIFNCFQWVGSHQHCRFVEEHCVFRDCQQFMCVCVCDRLVKTKWIQKIKTKPIC